MYVYVYMCVYVFVYFVYVHVYMYMCEYVCVCVSFWISNGGAKLWKWTARKSQWPDLFDSDWYQQMR